MQIMKLKSIYLTRLFYKETAMNSDNELQMKVTQELLWDPAVESMHVVVGVKNGIVTLTGYVQHFGKKQAAQQAAERVAGVKAVVNELDIKLPDSSERNDLDIAESALNALRLNTQVPRDAVKVAVESAWVTLEGSVDWHYQRIAAEHAVKNLPGIKGMINKIEIKPAALKNDIQEKIRNAFVRNAQIDATRVTLKLDGHKAVLAGSVRSWAERAQAESATWAAPGITQVENHILISA